MTRGKWLLIFVPLGVILFILIAPIVVSRIRPYPSREQWKDQAIAQIEFITSDPSRVEAQMMMTKNGGDGVMEIGWLGKYIILMESGEWLVYRNHCPKERWSHISDIFIAKGSDGKWYYSTCHFCKEMWVLRSYQNDYGAPRDIVTFAKTYNLREFDGKSNVCLEPTETMPNWPEEEW